MPEKKRCSWCGDDPVMVRYHDKEWGSLVRDGRALWEALTIDGFQAGLSWRTILYKRDAFRAAFKGFDPKVVARFSDRDVARLMADEGIVRSHAKVRAAIGNAKAYLAMQKQGEEFSDFVWTLAGGQPIQGGRKLQSQTPESERISKELKKRGFKFVGPVTVHAWMQAVGLINDHAPSCFRHIEVQAQQRKLFPRPSTANRGRGSAIRKHK